MEARGAAAQSADTVMSEAAPPPAQADSTHPQQQPPPPHPVMPGVESIPATLSHGGRFIQYNIFGNVFEVTAKYKPPIMPIGKGAYGIVWSVSLCFILPFPFPFLFLFLSLRVICVLFKMKNEKRKRKIHHLGKFDRITF